MAFMIRRARLDDAKFIARTILSAQRGHVSRGWFDIALDWPEPQCLAFVERIATAQAQSWWHISQFILAEVEGEPAAGLAALEARSVLEMPVLPEGPLRAAGAHDQADREAGDHALQVGAP